MALSRKELVGKVVNLTDKPAWAYSDTGDIVRLDPFSGERGDFCLVPSDCPIRGANLVVAKRVGVGRGGHRVSTLVLKDNPKVRVYPTKGR